MQLRRTKTLAAIALLALTVLPNSFALAGDTIAVQLASGRQFTGELDSRSDSDRLWLGFGGVNVSLVRPVEWSAIESITLEGQLVDKAELLQRVAASNPAETNDSSNGVSIIIRNARQDIDYAEQAVEALASKPKATHVDFHATLANWDGDPQPDGLLLHLSLLDANEQPVAASGSLQAELYAPVERRFQAVPHGRGTSVLPIARWSNAVRADDFRHGSTVIRLPFRAVKLRANDLASPYALLHVRIAVPGHGVFEASYDAIRVERFAPTRDLLERQGRSRRLTTEPPRHDGIGR